MASNRELIVQPVFNSCNYRIVYEGTNGEVPWDVAGEYTSRSRAELALTLYKNKKAALAPVVNATPEAEDLGVESGNTKRKQRA